MWNSPLFRGCSRKLINLRDPRVLDAFLAFSYSFFKIVQIFFGKRGLVP
jgi:hypothetical protein